MPVKHRLREVLTSPPHHTAARAARRARRTIDAWSQRRRDRNRATYALDGAPTDPLAAWLPPPGPPGPAFDADAAADIAAHILAHRFDLLGSGWVVVRHGMRCRGVEGARYDADAPKPDAGGRWLRGRGNTGNRAEMQRLWSLIEPPYVPIDWHLDFKSGYRWSERTWHADVPFAHEPGVDIKVPWELARLQHLPQLVVASARLAHEARGDAAPRDVCARLFRNQVLDFLATNPPRYGVNWRCTMDVAIRVANLVVARSLLCAAGARFDEAFEIVLTRAVYEHGRFIVDHLEWGPALRSNHYLSNVVGLLFAAAHLPATREIDAWLAFAVQELIDEVRIQFGEDGANFEGSTSYHRLSAEMVVYGTALVLGLPDERRAALATYDHTVLETPAPLRPAPIPMAGAGGEHPFPAWYVERLAGMRRFTEAMMPAQIGDNDSGRFLRLAGSYAKATVAESRRRYVNLEGYGDLPDDATYRRERGDDHRHLVEAIDALTCGAGVSPARDVGAGSGAGGDARTTSFGAGGDARTTSADAEVVRGLARGRTLAAMRDAEPGANPESFPDFGAFVYRAGRSRLLLRAGSIGQLGNGGHAHNDQLSFELFVDDAPVIVDPGTYLYTPAPASRNLFRSTAMHNTLVVPGREQNTWALGAIGLFSLRTGNVATVLRADESEWTAEHDAYGALHRRTVRIDSHRIAFTDRCPAAGAKMIALHVHPDVEVVTNGPAQAVELRTGTARVTVDAASGATWMVTHAPYSDAYGWCRAGRMLEMAFEAAEIEWSIAIGVG